MLRLQQPLQYIMFNNIRSRAESSWCSDYNNHCSIEQQYQVKGLIKLVLRLQQPLQYRTTTSVQGLNQVGAHTTTSITVYNKNIRSRAESSWCSVYNNHCSIEQQYRVKGLIKLVLRLQQPLQHRTTSNQGLNQVQTAVQYENYVK